MKMIDEIDNNFRAEIYTAIKDIIEKYNMGNFAEGIFFRERGLIPCHELEITLWHTNLSEADSGKAWVEIPLEDDDFVRILPSNVGGQEEWEKNMDALKHALKTYGDLNRTWASVRDWKEIYTKKRSYIHLRPGDETQLDKKHWEYLGLNFETWNQRYGHQFNMLNNLDLKNAVSEVAKEMKWDKCYFGEM